MNPPHDPDAAPVSAHHPIWDEVTQPGSHLVIVGGAEDRERQKLILKRFVELSGGSDAKILLVAVASERPESVFEGYQEVFKSLGVEELRPLLSMSRDELRKVDAAKLLDGVTGIYFSGGDQLRIATLLGGTQLLTLMEDKIRHGCTVGGTSAGASAMSDTMIIDWEPSDEPLAHNVRLSSGLGILRHLIIDQHFTERNRLSRVITAVAYHPGYLGMGVDEDTAAVVTPDGIVTVVGSGTVTIVDGSDISDCNVAETPTNLPFSVVGLKVHVLSKEHGYNLKERRMLEEQG